MNAAKLLELGAMMNAYDESKRPSVYLAPDSFARPVDVGEEVELTDGHGNKATGRVKAMVALVEVDLSTAHSGPNPEQESLL